MVPPGSLTTGLRSGMMEGWETRAVSSTKCLRAAVHTARVGSPMTNSVEPNWASWALS